MAKMFMVLMVFLALGSGINLVVSSANIQLSLTDKGLNYVNKVMVDNLVKQVKGLHVPSITLQKFWTRLDLARAKVTDIRLTSASFGVNNGLLQLTLNMNQVVVGGMYRSSLWSSTSSGTFNAQLNSLVINQYLSIGHNIKGQPIASNAGCIATIQSSTYQFENSWFLNMLANMARRAFQPMVGRKICDAVSQAIEKKGKILPTLYPEHHNAPGLSCTTISYPIKQQPIIEQDYIDFLITGEITSSCRPSNTSLTGQRLTRFVPAQDKMLSISFADDFINLLLNHHYRAGAMATHKFQSKPLSNVTIQITSPPVVITTSNGSIITFQGSHNVHFKSNLVVQIQNKKLSIRLTKLRAYLPVLRKGSRDSKANSSNIRHVVQSQLTKIQTKLNASLRHVIPLPLLDAMRLVNKHVVYDQGRVILQMDIQV